MKMESREEGSNESSIEQSQFDFAREEDMMEVSQHLSQLDEDYQVEEEEEGPIVKSGNGRLIKREPDMEEDAPRQSQALGRDGSRMAVGRPKLPPLGENGSISQINLRRMTMLIDSSWLKLFRPVFRSNPNRAVAEKIIAPIPPTKIGAMRYGAEVLLTLGAEVDPVSETQVATNTPDYVIRITEELREVTWAICQEWGLPLPNYIESTQTSPRAPDRSRSNTMQGSNQKPASTLPQGSHPPNLTPSGHSQPSIRHDAKYTSHTQYSPSKGANHRKGSASGSSDEDEERRVSTHTYVPIEAIPPFSRGSPAEAESWLRKFLYVATQARWSDKMMCHTFKFKLEGAASYWYTALPSAAKKRWKRLEAAFKENYSVGWQSPQEKYWNASREDKESALEYLLRLNALAEMAGIDYRYHNAADHIRRYLTTVRDHRVSDRLLALGITDAKILAQRYRTGTA